MYKIYRRNKNSIMNEYVGHTDNMKKCEIETALNILNNESAEYVYSYKDAKHNIVLDDVFNNIINERHCLLIGSMKYDYVDEYPTFTKYIHIIDVDDIGLYNTKYYFNNINDLRITNKAVITALLKAVTDKNNLVLHKNDIEFSISSCTENIVNTMEEYIKKHTTTLNSKPISIKFNNETVFYFYLKNGELVMNPTKTFFKYTITRPTTTSNNIAIKTFENMI